MIDVERGQVRAKSHYDCECSQQEFIAAAPGYCTSMLLNPDEMNKIRIPVPRRRRSKRIKTTSRILLAVAGCACFAAGYWCDMQVREQSRSMDEIGSQYMQSKDNSLYNALNSQHRHAWDDGNAWSIRRNMCYAASGACGAAIVITIAF